ncbi:unnamed protein product [Cyprideis torosa]|uniref:Uncharacterized protein n=1 Tax=Cyprideis torosa TaxID=163714 RepID=A0A7R8ZXQ5_9CRUS|nr:unnamed protein product [Cyprideis torosa]CAG0907474.1 unnamed protein product [Cyprideis torosa]
MISEFRLSNDLKQSLPRGAALARVFFALLPYAIEELTRTAVALINPVRLGVAKPTTPFNLVVNQSDALQGAEEMFFVEPVVSSTAICSCACAGAVGPTRSHRMGRRATGSRDRGSARRRRSGDGDAAEGSHGARDVPARVSLRPPLLIAAPSGSSAPQGQSPGGSDRTKNRSPDHPARPLPAWSPKDDEIVSPGHLGARRGHLPQLVRKVLPPVSPYKGTSGGEGVTSFLGLATPPAQPGLEAFPGADRTHGPPPIRLHSRAGRRRQRQPGSALGAEGPAPPEGHTGSPPSRLEPF